MNWLAFSDNERRYDVFCCPDEILLVFSFFGPRKKYVSVYVADAAPEFQSRSSAHSIRDCLLFAIC